MSGYLCKGVTSPPVTPNLPPPTGTGKPFQINQWSPADTIAAERTANSGVQASGPEPYVWDIQCPGSRTPLRAEWGSWVGDHCAETTGLPGGSGAALLITALRQRGLGGLLPSPPRAQVCRVGCQAVPLSWPPGGGDQGRFMRYIFLSSYLSTDPEETCRPAAVPGLGCS